MEKQFVEHNTISASADVEVDHSPQLATLNPPSLQFKKEDSDLDESTNGLSFTRHEFASPPSVPTASMTQLKLNAEKQEEELPPFQLKANKTGLPDQLKSGVENLSGFSLDDVNVHYNSSKPAQLQADAYAQGTDIHLGPGQEKHLPHEAWHVVQQKQGRVQPAMQMKGKVNVNDDAGLEKEADIMGAKATNKDVHFSNTNKSKSSQLANSITPMQLVKKQKKKSKTKKKKLPKSQGLIKIAGKYFALGKRGAGKKHLVEGVESFLGMEYTKTSIEDAIMFAIIRDEDTNNEELEAFENYEEFAQFLQSEDKLKKKRTKSSGSDEKWSRPNFSSLVYRMATASHLARTTEDEEEIKELKKCNYMKVRNRVPLQEEDLAVPHRYPWNGMKKILAEEDTENERPKSLSLNKSLLDMSNAKTTETLTIFENLGLKKWKNGYEKDKNNLQDDLKAAKSILQKDEIPISENHAIAVKKAFNNAPGNVPDLGPHKTVNIPVSNRLHLNAPKVGHRRRLSISSGFVAGMDKGVLDAVHKGVGLSHDKSMVVSTSGEQWNPAELEDQRQKDFIKYNSKEDSATSL